MNLLDEGLMQERTGFFRAGGMSEGEIDEILAESNRVAMQMKITIEASSEHRLSNVIGIGGSAFVFSQKDSSNVLKVYRDQYEDRNVDSKRTPEIVFFEQEIRQIDMILEICKKHNRELICPRFVSSNNNLNYIEMEGRYGTSIITQSDMKEINELAMILREAGLYPGDVEMVKDDRGIFFYDVAGFIPLENVDEEEWGTIETVLLSQIGNQL